MGPIQSLSDLVLLIWRRLPLILTIIVIGNLISFNMIVSSPKVYESVAVIQVDTPAVIDGGANASLPAARRVQLMEQRLMARSNILDVIQRLQLFEDAPGLSESEKISAVRMSTRIESIATPGVSPESRMSLAAIVITSRAETPQMAAAIANDFADSVVNRDRESREARIAESREYLNKEEARLSGELAEANRKLAEFTTLNEDALPSAQQYVQTELTQLTESENALDREIMELQRTQLTLVTGSGETGGRASSSLVQQIRSAEIELAQARRTLDPGHPEIKRLQETLDRLNTGGQAVSDMVRQHTTLLGEQLQQLDQQKQGIQNRRAEIDRARARMPQVAQELEAMTRQQRRLQDSYAEISRQLAQVETQRQLMDNDQAERFELLERALPPEYAAMSSRKKKAAAGLMGTFGLAAAIALGLELLHPVLRRTSQFARATGTLPVISLPYRPTRREIRIRRLKYVYMVVLLVVGLFVALWILGKIPGMPSPGMVATPTDGLG